MDSADVAAGQPIRRRADDDRIDEVIGKLGDLTAAVGVVANDVGYLKVSAERNGHSADQALAKLAEVASDLNASTAGREVVRFMGETRRKDREQDARIDGVEEILAEMRIRDRVNARWVRAGVAAMTTLISVPSVLWTMHLLGWF